MQISYIPGRAGLLFLLLTATASMAGAVTIKGTITDTAGKALPAMVAAAYTPTGVLQATATSDATGSYGLSLPAGKYGVLAYDPTGAYATEFGRDADSFDDPDAIFNANSNLTGVNFKMNKAGVVTGTVTAGTVPLSNITVAIYNLESGTRRGFALTGSDGKYTLGVPPGQYKAAAYDDSGTYAVSFFSNQNTFASAATLDLISGQPMTVDFHLALSAHLSGTVVDGDTNVVLPGASVFAYSTDGTAVIVSSLSDAAGNFTLTLGPGSYKVVAADANRIYAAGFVADANSFANDLVISVAAGQTIGAIRIPLHRAGVITGRVTEPSGTPLAGITVAAYNDDGSQRTTAQTDANGAYVLTLPAGNFRVAAFDSARVFATQFYQQRNLFANATAVVVAASQTTQSVDFRLSRGGRFTGTITDQSGGTPIAGVSVGAYDSAGNLMSVATTDSSGNYTLVAPAGNYKVIAFDNLLRYITAYGGGAPNYDTATVFEADGDSTQHVDFALRRGVRVSGSVIDAGAAFAPVSNVEIAALDLTGDRLATTRTNAGRFDLVLAPGTYKLLAVDPLGRFFATFYNGAWTLERATPIVVTDNGVSQPIAMTLIRLTRRHPVHH